MTLNITVRRWELFGVISGFFKGPKQDSGVHSSFHTLKTPSPTRRKLLPSGVGVHFQRNVGMERVQVVLL